MCIRSSKANELSQNHHLIHRPVVNEGWYEDFTKIFRGSSGFIYGSKANGYTVDQLLNTDKNFVYFASVQDLRGSSQVGGKFDKMIVFLRQCGIA